MTPEAEQRLRAYVRAIVEGGWVPRQDADDLDEEMLGHLIDRAETHIAAGATEDDAVRAAMAEFGAVAVIGSELGRTYHSRLWASTIGVLLTVREPASVAPGAIGGLRLFIAAEVLIWAAVGATALLTETPGRAVAIGVAPAVFVGAAALAHRGLGVGHAWALRFALGVAVLAAASGLVQTVAAPPGTTFVSVTGIAAVGILLWLARSWDQLRGFAAGSRPIGRRLGSALAAALVAPTLVAVALPVVPDPTQATAADVDMRLSMACGRRDLQVVEGPLLRDRQYADLELDLSWRRSDILPQGLIHLSTSSADGGDTAGFRVIEPAPIDIENGGAMPVWMLDKPDPTVIVAETGEVAGWFGATAPSVALIPETMGSFTVGIDTDRIQAGRTIHVGWSIGPVQDGTQGWPRVEVAYAHLDRFLLLGQVGCGERTTGGAGRTPAPAQERFLP